LDLRTTGEHYSWGHLNTSCHNIILGSLWLDHYGELVITNHTTGTKCVMKFTKAGWLSAGRYQVVAEVQDKEGNVKLTLHGRWNERLQAKRVNEAGESVGDEIIIWEANKEPITSKFNFSKFIDEEVINLNPELEAVLPAPLYPLGPTDSRLREDRRFLEAGDIEGAGRAKHQMEEVQRAMRKERDAKGEAWSPRYFERVPDDTFEYRWKFNGKYWDERDERVKTHQAAKAGQSSDAKKESESK